MNAIQVPKSRALRPTVLAIALSLVYSGSPYAALLAIPNTPLYLKSTVSPNVHFVLDNSGSMAWSNLPDAADRFAAGGWKYSGSHEIGGFSGEYGMHSHHCNQGYFNPNTTYTPPVNASGVKYQPASYTGAWVDGFNQGAGTLDLSANGFWGAGLNGGYYYQYSGTEPTGNFLFDATGTLQANTFFNECNSAIGAAPGNGVFTRVDINSATQATKDNYANWFSYYRTRMLAMKSAAGAAFAGLDSGYRVGFQTLNSNSTNFLQILPFTSANKTAWFNRFYGITPSGGTPLRTALDTAGRYYENGTMSGVTGVADPVTHACQKHYTILSSDGMWNDSFTFNGSTVATNDTNNFDDTALAALPASVTLPVTGTTLTAGSTWPFPYREGATAAPNTLADIAASYWSRDLRTGLANNVVANASDPASWQHMTTYTVGFGVKGTLDYPAALAGLKAGTTRWPTPVSNSATAVDDLWHAAINGSGDYLSAGDPGSLTTGLKNMLDNIKALESSSSSAAASTNTLQTGSRLYLADYKSQDWAGHLSSHPFDTSGTVQAAEWDAQTRLTSQTGLGADSRVILTRNATSKAGIPFQWTSLPVAQQDNLRTPPAGGTLDSAAVGQQRLEFLRGWSDHEGTLFRERMTTDIVGTVTSAPYRAVLGDIIESNPTYVGDPQAGYSDVTYPGYRTFRNSKIGRKPVVYVGANDGMLHGFDASVTVNTSVIPHTTSTTANSGKEVIAYVPSRVFPKLSKLTSTTYSGSHENYVNSSPMVGDADLAAGSGTPAWKTVLASGLGSGGQAYFALDVTNPASFSESNAASLVLWEFSDQDDADLGYSFNQPVVNRANGLSSQIVRMANGKWALIVGNGYNNTEADGNASTTGHAALFILFLDNTGAWTSGTDYIKISTNTGSVATPNGLATPLPLDTNGDGKVDVVYAGDLSGNMWKFDVSSSTPSSWPTSPSLLFAAGSGKPITSAPTAYTYSSSGRVVLFGTGKFIESSDTTTVSTQTLYGILDTGSTVSASNLVTQTITGAVTAADGSVYRTISSNAVNLAGSHKGWKIDLPSTGERVAHNAILVNGLALFSTLVPSQNVCDGGGDSWLMALDPFTGSAHGDGTFDVNGDGQVTSNETLGGATGSTTSTTPITPVGRKSKVGITPTPITVTIPPIPGTSAIGKNNLVIGNGNPGTGTTGSNTSGIGSSLTKIYASGNNMGLIGGPDTFTIGGADQPVGRVMWKEVQQ